MQQGPRFPKPNFTPVATYRRHQRLSKLVTVALFMAVALRTAVAAPEFDAAAAFGMRASVAAMRLSPDGQRVLYVAPRGARGNAVMIQSFEAGSKPRIALTADGAPERIDGCAWASNERVVCEIYGIVTAPELLPFWRMVAVNIDGSNPKLLGKRVNSWTQGVALADAGIIDWLPDQDGSLLMTRYVLPDAHLGSRLGSKDEGLGVDIVDTRTLESKIVEMPKRDAVSYLSDGRGTVRIVGYRLVQGATEEDAGAVSFDYRRSGSRDWQKLSTCNYVRRTGFCPYAVDHDLDIVYGFKKKDGRFALYSVALDGSLKETLLYARDDVDIDSLIQIGRRGRVVGASYSTDYRSAYYLDPTMEKLLSALHRAVPGNPAMRVVDSSVDESKLLIFANRDDDSGVYYLFDRASRQMQTFLVAHDALEGVALAKMQPITFPAADGTQIPGYLTLPPGKANAKGLPAIVMPHGGPSARDEWGFDWLSQFYAARGYAVLQPNFRGSAGYGDEWFQKNGFQSWTTAIGDVLDAGRWLVSQGIADPAKLAVVGWSYGGYAALQSAVADTNVFKAVVAVAPVTDLAALKEARRHWSDFYLVSNFIGDGPHVREGSPARNAEKIKVPVLLFHGTQDLNVPYAQSVLMDKALQGAGVRHECVTFDNLDHHLVDSAVRTEMLRKSDAFLREVMHF